MGKIVLTSNVTLDGVVQDPDGAEGFEHGGWFHLPQKRLDRAQRWFERWGQWSVLLGRNVPVARSFISIPAGVFGMPAATSC